MVIIFGLGNIGQEYQHTYHNVGFMAIDHFANTFGFQFTKTKNNGMMAEGMLNGEKVMLVKPTTFMNLSGNCVREYVHKFKLELSNIIVVYDDIDIPCGTYRLRKSGSAGTHNGMKNIVENLQSEDFARLRIGIGKKPDYMNLVDYVLAKVGGENEEKLNAQFENTDKILEQFVKYKDIEKIHI